MLRWVKRPPNTIEPHQFLLATTAAIIIAATLGTLTHPNKDNNNDTTIRLQTHHNTLNRNHPKHSNRHNKPTTIRPQTKPTNQTHE